VFDVNVSSGAFQSGITTSGSLVFTTQPALPPDTSFPTDGFTGGSANRFNVRGLYQHPIADPKTGLRITEPWYKFFDRAFSQANGPVDVSNGADVSGVLPPENGGTGTTTGLTELLPQWVQFTDESLLLGRGQGAGGGDGQEISLGTGLTMTGTVLSSTGGWMPLVTGAEPPVLVSDGAGHLIPVAYNP